MALHQPTMTLRDRRRVAAEGDVDIRSVDAYFAGRDLRPLTTDRIERALRTLGFEANVRAPESEDA